MKPNKKKILKSTPLLQSFKCQIDQEILSVLFLGSNSMFSPCPSLSKKWKHCSLQKIVNFQNPD